MQKVHSAWANLCVFFRCFHLSAAEATTTAATTRATTIERLQQSRVNINKKPAKLLSHETRRQATYACPVGTAQRAGPGSGQRRQQAGRRQLTRHVERKTRPAGEGDKASLVRVHIVIWGSSSFAVCSRSRLQMRMNRAKQMLCQDTWHILATCVRLRSTCACLCPGWLMPVVFPPPSPLLSLHSLTAARWEKQCNSSALFACSLVCKQKSFSTNFCMPS